MPSAIVSGILTGDAPLSYWLICPLSLLTVPEVFAKLTRPSFLLVSKVANFHSAYTAISRKVVGKVIWDMINTLFLTTVPVEPTFVAFLQHSQTHFHGLSYQFFQISLKNSELKTTQNAFRDCRVHFFRQSFSKQLYTHIHILYSSIANKRENSLFAHQ